MVDTDTRSIGHEDSNFFHEESPHTLTRNVSEAKRPELAEVKEALMSAK